MSVKSRIAELNARFAEKLTAKGVEASADETTTALIDKVGQIEQGGDDISQYVANFSGAFSSAVFPEGYILKLNVVGLSSVGSFANAFMNMRGVKKVVLTGGKGVAHVFNNAFASNGDKLEEVDFSGYKDKFSSLSYCFGGASSIVTLRGAFDLTDVAGTDNGFTGMTNLVNVEFVPNSIYKTISFINSSLLSAESAKSIINGLADYAGTENEYVYSLRLHGATKTILEEEGSTAPNGDTWLSYASDKGWTI